MTPIWEIALLALFSFCVQLLLMVLRGGSNIRVRLVPSPTQNPILNYEVRNVGNVVAKEVHVTFNRDADDDVELWNTSSASDLRFESLAPGEAYSSMFCTAPGWGEREPVSVTVRYRSGGLFPRLMDFDDERWWWRALGGVTSWLSRGIAPRRKIFVLDPGQFFAMRFNVGFAGKDELRALIEELRRTRQLHERDTRARGSGTGNPKPAEPSVAALRHDTVRTEGADGRWAQRRPVG